jgi:hypothetical protein
MRSNAAIDHGQASTPANGIDTNMSITTASISREQRDRIYEKGEGQIQTDKTGEVDQNNVGFRKR